MITKICGITSLKEVEFLNELLPDYIGFVFAESKRRIDGKKAYSLYKALNKNIRCVGVFRNNSIKFIKEILEYVPLDIIQLHGDEGNDFIEELRSFHSEIWKGVSISCREDMISALDYKVDTLILDGSIPGGGQVFNWEYIKDLDINKRIILAGGLNEDNLQEGIEFLKPFGVDVSSGVESIDEMGNREKDRDKVARFIRKVRESNERKI